MNRRSQFAQRLRAAESLTGTFQKLPHHQSTELLALAGVDFAVLDCEHAPFSQSQIDQCLLASQAYDMPLLVRVPALSSESILAALDMGASGVFVPHVASAEIAQAAVESAFYRSGKRGFSPSTRAGAYGTRGLRPFMEAADRSVAVILQIEDAAALDCLDRIASVDRACGLFVGRADLAASMQLDWDDPELDRATVAIISAARKAGIAAGAYLAEPSRAAAFRNWGASFFVVGSDQGLLRTEVARVVTSMKGSSA